ncbi:unnamed protein product, partial [Linum tenue]
KRKNKTLLHSPLFLEITSGNYERKGRKGKITPATMTAAVDAGDDYGDEEGQRKKRRVWSSLHRRCQLRRRRQKGAKLRREASG